MASDRAHQGSSCGVRARSRALCKGGHHSNKWGRDELYWPVTAFGEGAVLGTKASDRSRAGKWVVLYSPAHYPCTNVSYALDRAKSKRKKEKVSSIVDEDGVNESYSNSVTSPKKLSSSQAGCHQRKWSRNGATHQKPTVARFEPENCVRRMSSGICRCQVTPYRGGMRHNRPQVLLHNIPTLFSMIGILGKYHQLMSYEVAGRPGDLALRHANATERVSPTLSRCVVARVQPGPFIGTNVGFQKDWPLEAAKVRRSVMYQPLGNSDEVTTEVLSTLP